MVYVVNWRNAAPSKIGPDFKIEVSIFFLLTKTGLLNWYSSMKKKKEIEKNQLIFDKQNKQLWYTNVAKMCDQITELAFQAFYHRNQKTRANSGTAGTLNPWIDTHYYCLYIFLSIVTFIRVSLA